MLEYELANGKKPKVAIMGLAFKPDIDDLRESPAKYIAQKVMQSEQNGFLIVEPNIKEHSIFRLTDYKEAYEKADIVAFLVAHKEFKTLPYDNNKKILDFVGIFKNENTASFHYFKDGKNKNELLSVQLNVEHYAPASL